MAFRRWQDSPSDLLRLDLTPGSPTPITAQVLGVAPDETGLETGYDSERYRSQPNHGINVAHRRAWITNLIFGAPLEIDLEHWRPARILEAVETQHPSEQLTTTAHFGWSPNDEFAFFHQARIWAETEDDAPTLKEHTLVRVNTTTGQTTTWRLTPPKGEVHSGSMNFHSAFCFPRRDSLCVGLLRTAAVLDHWPPHNTAHAHGVRSMQRSHFTRAMRAAR